MAKRRTFFSFHYQRDIWRANVVRNSNVVIEQAPAGFTDASLWEAAKRRGDFAVKRMIDDALYNTSVTVVLIGTQTSSRPYVNYEIEKSIERGNGMLGVRIHNIRDQRGSIDLPGLVPQRLLAGNYRIYTWNNDHAQFAQWVEEAYHQAFQV
jgi:hypothetical protein